VTELGDKVDELVVPDFHHPPSASRLGVGAPVLGRLLRAYSLRPVVVKDLCTGCGACIAACPKKTIRMVRGKALVKHNKCIRCYCCHEMCQSRAIELRRSTGGRFIARVMGSGNLQ
jgi:ferredoxin